MSDEVKVTILGVPRETRQALKVACVNRGTNVSEELRKRLPRIISEINQDVMTYEEISDLLLSIVGVANLALAQRGPDAKSAMREINGDLRRFLRQVMTDEERRP